MASGDQGFASMARSKHRDASSTGGKNADKNGKKYKLDSAKAKEVGALGRRNRKIRLVNEAIDRLVKTFGFDKDDLNTLTENEILYYGGGASNPKRRQALRDRFTGTPATEVADDQAD